MSGPILDDGDPSTSSTPVSSSFADMSSWTPDSNLLGVFPDCAECEVAQRDHLMQIYDPGIDFCVKCLEARNDHKIIKCASDELDECQLCSSDLAQTLYDLVQVQPKYSDSRGTLKRKAQELDENETQLFSDYSHRLHSHSHSGHSSHCSRGAACCTSDSKNGSNISSAGSSSSFYAYENLLGDGPSSSASSKQSSSNANGTAPLYCHWTSNSFTCEDPFFSEADLNDHIKKHHINLAAQPKLHCSWDSCDTAVDYEDLFNHIKTDHLWLQPHGDCQKHDVIPGITVPQTHSSASAAPTIELDPTASTSTSSLELSSPALKKEVTPDNTSSTICKWLVNGVPCNHQCGTSENLSNHLLEHVGSRQMEYICHWQGCDRKCKPFAQKQKIVRHLHVHSNYKPYKCNICGGSFSQESALRQHERVHSGEKPFKCKYCSRRFAASAALSVHIRLHTGEKPLKCKYCGKRFSESSNLNKHVRRHFKGGSSTTSPLECPHCEEHFAELKDLEAHISSCHESQIAPTIPAQEHLLASPRQITSV